MLSSRPISRNGDGMPRLGAKTPARGLQNENAIRHAPMTVGKAQGIPQTPFQAKNMKGDFDKDGPRTGKGKASIQLNTISRPFLDKTPFPNRTISLQNQTPFQRDQSQTPDSAQRPSSTRKHIRLPRHSQKFETPMNQKHHWDVSDDEIELAQPAVASVMEDVEVEDYDEIEYMPPNTLDLPYQPPIDFDLPNYKEVGKLLRNISQRLVFEDPPPPPDVVPRDEDIAPVVLDLPVPELDETIDDPFHTARRKESAPSKPSSSRTPTINTQTASKPLPVSRSRSFTATGRTTQPSRPPTSTGRSTQPSRPPTSIGATTNARTASHARSVSTSTFSTRPVVKTTTAATSRAALSRAPVTTTKSTSAKPMAGVPSRRPATSASTYKPLVSVRARSGSTMTTAATRPVAQKTITTKSEDISPIKLNLAKGDELGDDFLFDL